MDLAYLSYLKLWINVAREAGDIGLVERLRKLMMEAGARDIAPPTTPS